MSENPPYKSNAGHTAPEPPVPDQGNATVPLEHESPEVSSSFAGSVQPPKPKRRSIRRSASTPLWLLIAFLTFVLGLVTGYGLWGLNPRGAVQPGKPAAVSPPTSYTLRVRLGDLGPRLVAAGAIDYSRFVQLYQQNGQPLTVEQQKIMTSTSDAPIIIDGRNAYFLLNLFWAVGLTNQNPILTTGPLAQQGKDKAGSFASTGGWTLGTKTPVELLASTPLIPLTAAQQASVEAVTAAVYRPCCGNSTLFPDCNHGMAMSGLLELMASQGATQKEMLEAAKYVNSFWFPQQAHELAVFFKASQQLDFAQVDPAEVVGAEYSSGSGAQKVHQWLEEHDLLDHNQNNGGGCGV